MILNAWPVAKGQVSRPAVVKVIVHVMVVSGSYGSIIVLLVLSTEDFRRSKREIASRITILRGVYNSLAGLRKKVPAL